MFRVLVSGFVEFFQDGELKAVIAAENLNAFIISIGLDPEPVAEPVPEPVAEPVLKKLFDPMPDL